MKKAVVLAAMGILLLSACSVLRGAPVGNPAKPVVELNYNPYKVSAEIDLVKERALDYAGTDREIDHLNWYLTRLSYVHEDWVEFYILLGMVDDGEFTTAVKYETGTGFAWGLGQTILLHEFENGLKVGMDARYRQTEPDVDKLTTGAVGYSINDANVSGVEVEIKEWHLALGISRELDGPVEITQFIPFGWILMPYAGIKYSDVDIDSQSTIAGTSNKSSGVGSDDNVGLFLGCDVLAADNASFGIEMRFLDEIAYSVNFSYRF